MSTRDEVEKRLGKGDPGSYFVEYQGPYGSIAIRYAKGDCTQPRETWNFPQWTVTEVYFDWPMDSKIDLDDVLLNRRAFKKKQMGDVLNHSYYVNEEFGVEVIYDRNVKSALSVDLRPAVTVAKNKRCTGINKSR